MAPGMVTATELQQVPSQKERRKSSVRREFRDRNDKTWLEIIENERRAQKIWEKKWAPLILTESHAEDGKESTLPRQKIRKEKEFKPRVEIPVEPSPKFPTTSSGIIGLRGYKEHWIEKFGPLYQSPKLTIEPPKPELPEESSDEEEDPIRKMKYDPRRTWLYTTSRIYLR